MLTVALSGGIASGKTAVSDIFKSLGVPVIDADILSRKAVAPGTRGLEAIRQRFGIEVIDANESLDRARLRQIVFSDRQARKDLESIIHPEVRRLTAEALNQHKKNEAPYCLVVIPLLVETKQYDKYDHVIIVDVGEQTQIERVMQRDDSTEEQARKILSSQATREARLAIANTVVDNSGTLADLKSRVNSIHQSLLTMAAIKKSG